MKIKKKFIASTIAFGFSCVVVPNSYAALVTDTVLAFDAGAFSCTTGGVYPDCTNGLTTVTGSYFALDTNADGVLSSFERFLISPGTDGGIVIGRTQSPGEIDSVWTFKGSTGSHLTTVPVTVVNDFGTTKELDFSGWGITWNGIPNIPLGGDSANFPTDTGLATIVCETSACANGETFSLDYVAHVPWNDPSGFGGVLYGLHLEGAISAVPLPAAVWLFGSGLFVLAGVARSREI